MKILGTVLIIFGLLLIGFGLRGYFESYSHSKDWHYRTFDNPDGPLLKRKFHGVQALAEPDINGQQRLWVGIFFEGDICPSLTFYYDQKYKTYSYSERDGRLS